MGMPSGSLAVTIAIRTYIAAEVAGFRFTKAEHGIFSNMHPDYPIGIPTSRGMVRVDSSETVYQLLKFPGLPEAQARVIAAGGPKPGKVVAGAEPVGLRKDWDGPGRISAMRWAIRLKLAQHREAVLAALDATGDRPIVEISKKDAFWGAKPDANGLLIGCNVLGRLWMELREELRLNRDAYLDSVPAPGLGHRILGAEAAAWRRTRTLNVHIHGKPADGDPHAVYVGRPGPFGNPVEVTEETPRGSALVGYLEHLRGNPDLVDRIRVEMMGKDAVCWCAPRACHGDIIRHIADGNPVPDCWEVEPKSEPAEDPQASFALDL